MKNRHSYLSSMVFGALVFSVTGLIRLGATELFQKRAQNLNALTSAVAIHSYDLLHYQISLRIDPAKKFIAGSTGIRCIAKENDLQQLEFDLVDLQVDSVFCAGVKVNYHLTAETIITELDRSYADGDTVRLTIFYQGSPKKGLYFSGKATYTLTDPIDSRRWFPCYDHPSDKATVALHLTVPSGKKIAATGLPVTTVENNDGTFTQVWKHDYPITTYNIHIGISDFATFSHQYADIPILYFVYPEDLSKARNSFSNLPDMMACMIQQFGPYPFEKYGMDELPLADYLAMEHQTMTSILPVLVTGDHTSDITFAHELSHQWFGNSLSVADWQYMWLNEGLASYFGACYIRYKYGESQFQNEMRNFKNQFIAEDAQIRYPLADPPWDYIFGRTIYYKGAWVAAMLHNLLGDDAFWSSLKSYAAKFAYASVTSADFQNVCEQVSGQELDWFFNQWLYSIGYPEFTYSSYSKDLGNGFSQVDVSVVQTHSENTIYRVPVEIQVKTDLADTVALFWLNEKAENFTVIVPGAPRSITWDPQEKILARALAKPGFTRPRLLFEHAEINDAAGNHNRIIGFQEQAELIVSLKNAGIRRENIVARLYPLSDEIKVWVDSARFEPMEVFQVRQNHAHPFVIQNKSVPGWHMVPVSLVITADPNYQDTLYFDLAIGEPNLILVDSDAQSGLCQKYYAILDSLKIGYAYWDVDRYGSPFGLVYPYQTLVWFTGTDSSEFLTLATEDSLRRFLDAGGNLLLTGRHVANRLYNREFFRTYLHAQWQGQTSTYILSCAKNDPVCIGDKLALTSRDGSQDLLAAADAPQSVTMLTYLGTDKGAALRYRGHYKLIYLGFGLEDVVNDNPRLLSGYSLMQQILNWFAGTVMIPFDDSEVRKAERFELYASYPNPFNGETRIRYAIRQDNRSPVEVVVQNLLGQTVKVLQRKPQKAGFYELRWDGTDQDGMQVGSGTYLLVLRQGHHMKTEKMLLLR